MGLVNRAESENMYADIVVGSGISGLTAATLLAKNGREVLLLEQGASPGGAIRQFHRGGIAFDVGCHYTGCLGNGQFLQKLWAYCGVGDTIEVRSCRDSYDSLSLVGTDSPVRSWFDYGRLQDELCAAFPGDAIGIERYLQEIRSICGQIPYYNMELSLPAFFENYRRDRRSLAGFLKTEIGDEKLRRVLAASGILYGVPSAVTPLETHAMVMHGYYSGAAVMSGGGQEVVDAFVDRFIQLGGVIRCNSKVVRLLCDNGAVTGVELEGGERLACRRLVYTGHPAAVVDMVPQGIFRPAYTKRLRSLKNSLSFFAIFARAEKRIDWSVGPLNYLRIGTGSSDEVISAESSQPLGKRLLMMTGTCGCGGCTAKDEYGIILLSPAYWDEVECFVDRGKGKEYQEYKERVTQFLVKEAEGSWSHIVGRITPLASGTPLTFHRFLAAPEGCSYGVMHSLDQYTPDIRTRLSGLYLAGQSIFMTGLVGASVASVAAVGEIIGMEELWNRIRTA